MPPDKYPWQELFTSPQALIFSLIPPFQNLGLPPPPPQQGGLTLYTDCPGPILESKGMHAFFRKGAKKSAKRAEIWAKMYKISKYFVKRQPHACKYHMHETARICHIKNARNP